MADVLMQPCSSLFANVDKSLKVAVLGKRRAFDRVLAEEEAWVAEERQAMKAKCTNL